MIIYNNIWLDNLQLHFAAEDEHRADCLTGSELKAIKEKYPVGFYRPGIFFRVGLFILTCIIILFSAGLLSLILMSSNVINGFGWPIFLGLVTYTVLELMVREKKYYRAGVDDALLWISALLLTGGFAWMMENNHTGTFSLNLSITVFVLTSYLTLRFADVLMSAVCCAALFAVVFYACQNLGPLGIALLPFVMMIAAALLYTISLKLKDGAIATYYTNCLVVIQIGSLVTLYLAGNYYIVRELGNQLSTLPGNIDKTVPFGWFFWLWTVLMPFAYIARGLIKKDVILLRVGLLLIAAAVFTFRNYYHVLSAELAFILSGSILLTSAYGIIRYLKEPKHGFTYADDNRVDVMNQLQVGSLIIGKTFGHTHTATSPDKPGSPFGGGSAGGGGSSDSF